MTLGDRFRIHDSFLPQNEYDNLRRRAFSGEDVKWTLQCSASEPSHVDRVFLSCDVQDDPFYNTHLLSYIQRCFDSKVEPLRIYYNGQHPNFHGSYHTDDGDVTAILYVNVTQYQPSWGGWTELYDGDTDERHMIPPMDNRLLLFDAKIPHRGLAFLNPADPIRVNLTYKMKFVS